MREGCESERGFNAIMRDVTGMCGCGECEGCERCEGCEVVWVWRGCNQNVRGCGGVQQKYEVLENVKDVRDMRGVRGCEWL